MYSSFPTYTEVCCSNLAPPKFLACRSDSFESPDCQTVCDMELVRQRRRRAAEKNNARENKRRIKCNCKPGDKVLILPQRLDPKMTLNQGPYDVVDHNTSNGTLQIRRGNCIEPINIRNVRPYFGHRSGGD